MIRASSLSQLWGSIFTASSQFGLRGPGYAWLQVTKMLTLIEINCFCIPKNAHISAHTCINSHIYVFRFSEIWIRNSNCLFKLIKYNLMHDICINMYFNIHSQRMYIESRVANILEESKKLKKLNFVSLAPSAEVRRKKYFSYSFFSSR